MSGVQRGPGAWGFLRLMSSKPKPLPMDIIREALEIDPTSKTGLRWKWRPRHHFNCNGPRKEGPWKMWNARYSGKEAGRKVSFHGKWYFSVGINNKDWLVHRIIFEITRGASCDLLGIDHIDGNGMNNDPSNLRLATQVENMRNRGAQRNNTSGRKGVFRHKSSDRWIARIWIRGRGIHLGIFDDIDDASAAYESAAREYFGEFYKETTTP
jgi:hypothetical protein